MKAMKAMKLVVILMGILCTAGALQAQVNIYHTDVVLAGHTDTYTVTLPAGETTRIQVRGDGDTDLDLFVYDENGNLIASDTDYTDNCIVNVTPRWTGVFYIRIVNRGSVYNQYVLRAV